MPDVIGYASGGAEAYLRSLGRHGNRESSASDITECGTAERPAGSTTTATVHPPGGPRHAHHVRLAVRRDPGAHTVQEEHHGTR